MLHGLRVELNEKEIDTYLTDVHAPVLEFSKRTGLFEVIGEDHIFPTIDTAVRAIEISANPVKVG